MFKKLDKLVLRAFIGPFVATFFITLLVLIIQFFWLYIDDFVGKGLDASLIAEFIWYQSAVLVPLALPLAILLSSLMTFGNLGETFELVAIKAAGISLLRFMRPLFIFTVFICGIAFLFSNYIIPVAALKSTTLLRDIVYAKPAFDLREGVFYDNIPQFAIKVGKKESNDSVVRDVIIYEQSNAIQDNFIIARSGIMKVSPDKRFLEFNLKNGRRYEERTSNGYGVTGQYVRMAFKEYKKKFDLTTLGLMARTPDSLNRNGERYYNMRQLDKAIDSIQRLCDTIQKQVQLGTFSIWNFRAMVDSNWNTVAYKDTGRQKEAQNFSTWLPDSARKPLAERVTALANTLSNTIVTEAQRLKDTERILRKHKIEWHRKVVLSLACLVLFLIGAPLGSIIRKGGLGMPLILAIGFFMLFYFSSTTGEKFAKENTMSVFAGMWLATFILLPIGLFLTYKALRDSQLFNKDAYRKIISRIRGLFGRKTTSN